MIPMSIKDISVKRRPARQNVRGILTEQPGGDIIIKGNVQPESNLRTIKETYGANVIGAIKIYSETKFQAEGKSGDADLVLWDDIEWEVVQSRKYEDVIPHYKSIAVLRKDERP